MVHTHGNYGVSAKRYRYTGKEKDDETGFYYHGARYYAPWLGRWTAADPAGMADSLNLYRYSRDNPIVYADPGGTESKKPFAPVGSANWQVGTRTDAQLHGFLKAMTPEQRGALREASTGAVQARIDAFNQKYELASVTTLPETPVEGSPPEAEEVSLAEPPGLAHLQSLTPGVRNSPALGLRSLTSTAAGGTFAAGAAAGSAVLLAKVVPVVLASTEAASLAVAASPRLVAVGQAIVNALSAEGAPTIISGVAAAGGAALRGPAGELIDEFGDDAARALKGAGDELVDAATGTGAVERAIVPFYPANNGFLGATSQTVLQQGQIIDRVGGSAISRFFSPAGTPLAARALPPGTSGPLQAFEVLKPFSVEAGTVAPAFGQLGMGTQFRSATTLGELSEQGFLRAVP